MEGNFYKLSNGVYLICATGWVGCMVAFLYKNFKDGSISLVKDSHYEYIDPNFYLHDRSKTKLDKRGIKKDASIVINEFTSAFKDKKHINLGGLYSNFRPYSVEKMPKENIPRSREDEILYVDQDNFRESLLRELLRLASTKRLDEDIAEGFERSKIDRPKVRIGMGLNEGYKDVLLERYFKVEPKYPSLCDLAKLVEDLVGQRLMEEQFFEGDLYNFVRALNGKTWISFGEEYLKQFDVIYRGLCGSRIAKSIAERTYRELVFNLSKQVMLKARDIYLGDEISFWHNSKTDNCIVAKRMMLDVNMTLSRGRKVRGIYPGIPEAEIDKLIKYEEEHFGDTPLTIKPIMTK
ncbi:MAG TPA: hypothetical protein DCY94_04085 [Firmicutes bacterium]|nr:hypothetical protein [Bacillota bacterium]